MLKERKNRLITVIVAVVLIVGCLTVFARQTTETISVMYDNIKILIDGIEYTATDANGNVIEPFIYNGTTYLPVRGIANAFNKDVSWEAQTSTVALGSKSYDWLDQMGYANYETTGNKNALTAWEIDRKATDKVKYDRGIKFYLDYQYDYGKGGAKLSDDEKTKFSYQNVEYLLNSNYKTFEGKVACAEEGSNTQNVIIKFYGDGNLIYTSPPLSKGAKPVGFSLDVSNYKLLKINASIPNPLLETDWGESESIVGIVDARLAKK